VPPWVNAWGVWRSLATDVIAVPALPSASSAQQEEPTPEELEVGPNPLVG
jgi:hypothetical protein